MTISKLISSASLDCQSHFVAQFLGMAHGHWLWSLWAFLFSVDWGLGPGKFVGLSLMRVSEFGIVLLSSASFWYTSSLLLIHGWIMACCKLFRWLILATQMRSSLALRGRVLSESDLFRVEVFVHWGTYLLLGGWSVEFLSLRLRLGVWRVGYTLWLVLWLRFDSWFRLHNHRKKTLLSNVVLFVALNYVIHKWTVLWKEQTGNLQRFAVPHLRRPDLNVLLWAFLLLHLGGLESNLCSDTEVGDDVEDYLL